MTSAPSTDILVVLHDFALGGTERVALRLAAAWVRAGRGVRLLCGDPSGPAAAWLDPRVELVACQPPIARGPGARARLARAAAAELASRPARILFVPGNHHWPIIPHAAALERRPVIVAQLSNPIRRPDRGLLRQALAVARARRLLRHVDAVATLTIDDAHEVDRLLGRAVARHLPLPVLDDDASDPRPLSGSPEVLVLGRLAAQKRPDIALRAFAAVARDDVRLVFVGEGPRRRALERLARRLEVADRVTFAGVAEQVRPWLDRARVLLLPSDYEGFGAVIVEALAAGRPVVATDRSPAAVALVDRPERGRVVPARDVREVSRALESVLSTDPSPWPTDAPDLEVFQAGVAAEGYLRLFQLAEDARRSRRP